MTFLFNGYLFFIVQVIPFNERAIGYYKWDTQKLYVIESERDNFFVIHHEIAHHKYHKYFSNPEVLKFWNEIDLLDIFGKGVYPFNLKEENPEEKMANVYGCYQTGVLPDLPKQVKWFFENYK